MNEKKRRPPARGSERDADLIILPGTRQLCDLSDLCGLLPLRLKEPLRAQSMPVVPPIFLLYSLTRTKPESYVGNATRVNAW
jgi:hypothetical protein